MAHTFVMPIVEPPPAGQTYETMLQNVGMTVTPDSVSRGIRVRFSSASAAALPILSMGAGQVRFLPAGQSYTPAHPRGFPFGTAGPPTFAAAGGTDALLLRLTKAQRTDEHLRVLGIPATSS